MKEHIHNDIHNDMTMLSLGSREVIISSILFYLSDEEVYDDNGRPIDKYLNRTPFEVYCQMKVGLDIFIEEEQYETCAKIRDFLETPVMKDVDENFAEEVKHWAKTKKIF